MLFEVQRLKGLVREKVLLKRLLADAMLDHAALKDLLARKFWCPAPSGALSRISRRTPGRASGGRDVSQCRLQGRALPYSATLTQRFTGSCAN